MPTIGEVRLANLEVLVKEAGGASALSDFSGVSPVYISQLRNRSEDAKTGRPREMGSVTARKLEACSGMYRGWMDQDHKFEPEGTTVFRFVRLTGNEAPVATDPPTAPAAEAELLAKFRALPEIQRPKVFAYIEGLADSRKQPPDPGRLPDAHAIGITAATTSRPRTTPAPAPDPSRPSGEDRPLPDASHAT